MEACHRSSKGQPQRLDFETVPLTPRMPVSFEIVPVTVETGHHKLTASQPVAVRCGILGRSSTVSRWLA